MPYTAIAHQKFISRPATARYTFGHSSSAKRHYDDDDDDGFFRLMHQQYQTEVQPISIRDLWRRREWASHIYAMQRPSDHTIPNAIFILAIFSAAAAALHPNAKSSTIYIILLIYERCRTAEWHISLLPSVHRLGIYIFWN